MKGKFFDCLATIAGGLLVCGGLFMRKLLEGEQGILLIISSVCVGLGCVIFGRGLGKVIDCLVMKSEPEYERQLSAEIEDECKVAIANRAKAKAYDMMVLVFGALMISLVLMGVELPVVALLVVAYLFVVGYGVYYRVRYDKEG